jgi:hypothetical protein
MFRAAATVGQATRPLLAFYGLNQAGRAIAAAASDAQDDKWRLSGHGITSKNLDGPLHKIAIRCDAAGSNGSFIRLSDLLESPVWAKDNPVTLSFLWDCIPENRLAPLGAEDDTSREGCPLLVDTTRMYGEPHPLASVPVAHFPPWVVNSPDSRPRADHPLRERLRPPGQPLQWRPGRRLGAFSLTFPLTHRLADDRWV